MAYIFEEEVRIDIRRFCGYSQPTLAQELTGSAATLEERLGSLSEAQGEAVLSSFVAPLRLQYKALLDSHENMGLSELAVIKFDPNQLANRMTLITSLRLGLCAFIGVNAGPEIAGEGNGIVVGRLVRA